MRFYPDHPSIVGPFVEAFSKVYGKIPTVRSYGTHFCVSITSKTVVSDLLKESAYSSLGWYVPKWILKSKNYSKEWLRAFFDAEASVSKYDVRVQSINKSGLLQVKSMLKLFNIKTREYRYSRQNPRWNVNYHLSIQKNSSRLIFLRTIGFNHSEKLKKLLTAEVA